MNFFKSILSEDPDTPIPEKLRGSGPNSPTNSGQTSSSHHQPDSNSNSSNTNSTWSFGGLMKTLSTRSETVLETYRRDLEEFRSGLQKETEMMKEVGASVAQGVMKSTVEIIAHGKDTLLAPSVSELDESAINDTSHKSLDSWRYSRFDAQLRSIQIDVNTYCEEPQDLDDYSKWKLGFVLEEKDEEIESLFEENGDLGRIYKGVVPNAVDQSSFWCRYFYKVHKLKLQEDVRANLVKRTIVIADEEQLSWDADDNGDEEEEDSREKNVGLSGNDNKESSNQGSTQIVNKENPRVLDAGNEKKFDSIGVDEGNVVEQSADKVSDEEVKSEGSGLKSDHNSDWKADNGESLKESDKPVLTAQTSSQEEEDLEWDEIEDLGSNEDEKEVTHSGSPNKANLLKRLSVAEDDEDLSWDIEDDDAPVNAGAK